MGGVVEISRLVKQNDLELLRRFNDQALSATITWQKGCDYLLGDWKARRESCMDSFVALSRHYASSQMALSEFRNRARRNWMGQGFEAGHLRVKWVQHCEKCGRYPVVLTSKESLQLQSNRLANGALVHGKPVSLAIKNTQGQILWFDHSYQHHAPPNARILGSTSREIWQNQYGQKIYENDLDVGKGYAMLVEEFLPVHGYLQRRLAIRFPYKCDGHNRIEQIAVIGFPSPPQVLQVAT